MASNISSEDPYSWTVDRLVYELCHNPQPVWASQAKKALMPASDVFEKAIRDNVLDGESFMSMELVDVANELAVSAFGFKRNIYKIIRFFRSISTEYQRQNIVDTVMPYIYGVESPQMTTSHLSARPQSVTHGNQTPLQNYHSPRISNVVASTPVHWPSSILHAGTLDQGFRQQTPEEGHTAQTDLEVQDAAKNPGFQGPPSEAGRPSEVGRAPRMDAGLQIEMEDHTFQGSNPEQRQAQEVVSSSRELDKAVPQTELGEEPLLKLTMVPKAPKRVAPTFVSHITQDCAKEYNLGYSGHVTTQDIVAEDTDSDRAFLLTGSMETSEARKYLASTTKALLLHNDTVRSAREDSHARSRRLRRDVVDDARSTPSVEQTENHFLVQEQQDPQLGEPKTRPDGADLPYELAQLLARNPPIDGDDGYAIFGESGDEGEYDEETWDEIEAEIKENRDRIVPAGTLKEDAVNKAIDEAIEEMIVEWRSNKLPKTQNKGYRMWNEATRNHSGAQYIADSNFWLNRFEGAIRRLRAAIIDGAWLKVADIKGQCRSLEESVFQREEHKYYLSILQSKEPPPRPDWETLSRARNRDQPKIPEGEEVLESDPEPSSDDGFIEDDTSDTGSIPFETPSITNRPADAAAGSDLEFQVSESAGIDTDAMSPKELESSANVNEPSKSIEDSSSDSDDQIIGSMRRRPPQQSPHTENATPSRKPQLSQRIDESDSESEIDSDLDAPPRLPKPIWRKVGTEHEPIELTSSSPSAPESQARHPSTGSIRTPSLNPVTASSPSSIRSGHLRLKYSANDGPNFDDVEAIRDLEWDDLEVDQDNRRALAKAVYELELEFAAKLRGYLGKIVGHDERAYELLKNAVCDYGRGDAIEKVATRDQPLAHSLGLLFVTYNNAMDCMDEPVLSGGMLDETYEAIEIGFQKFFKLLDLALKAYCDSRSLKKRTGKKRKSSDIEILDEPADDSDVLVASEDQDQENREASAPRSTKKRKKKVLQSQEAETQQVDDRLRIAEQELKRTALLQKMKDMADNAGGDLDNAAMHPVSFDPDAPTIYLDPHIGRKVKPHQENGIQFMWRELTAGKGCMLAHTMGLGKTMQVISVLVTIAQASRSDDQEKRNQVPQSLQVSRTLILSPPSLVDNWHDEILMWTPPGSLILGEVRKIAAATESSLRMRNIKRWARDGGVLLMSYSLFKQIVEKTSKSIPEALRESYAEMLTHIPNIVVADEAHHMKNPKSGLAKAAKQLTTKARIALTGSPLSNHLEEYHQMVDWISPGYLGSLVQFKAKYSEPIKEGLYSDSTASERRTSARKLLVLKRDLDPKICRADISAIAKDMPNKAEFFITIPLTTVQKDAYSAYAKHMLRDHVDGSLKQAKIWSWLSVLSLLLNHPSAFVRKLKDRREPESESAEQEREASVDTEDLTLPADVPLSSVGLSSEATKDILGAFGTMTQNELEQVQHSYRSLLTARIVKESMRIKEKVLIFSHSIPTLDYLEQMLEKLNCTYARIDGSTSMPARQGMVKSFNNQRDVEVMLISTTAGGLGLNLQGANRVILYDFNFNPTWEEQAIGRAYRLGQEKHVFVYRFRAGGTFEEIIYNMSIFKTQLFARVVDKRNPMRFASKNLSDYLFPPREVEQAALDECVGKDPEVLDRIMNKVTCIRKVELTETFQIEEDDELTPEELKQAEQEYQDEVLGRTDPVQLIRLQRERQEKAMHQARRAEQQPSTPRASMPQRPAPTQVNQMVYPRLPSDLRDAGLTGPNRIPQASLSTYDDMELDQPGMALPRGRANSLPRSLPQIDGEDDRNLACNPQ